MCDVYKRLAERLDQIPNGYPATSSGVELKILRKIFDHGEAEMALKLKTTPETAAMIAERLGEPLPQVEALLDIMARKGQIWSEKRDGEQTYTLFLFLFGMYELQMPHLDKELADLFTEYAPALIRTVGGFKPAMTRVVPVNGQVAARHQVHPYEDLRHIMDKAKSFQVIDCLCRKQSAIQGRPCKHTLENCLVFSEHEGAFDRYPLGRTISRDEALSVLAQAEEEGLVHCTFNVQSGPMFVCNCCTCCCGILRSVKWLKSPYILAGSNFFALVDKDSCVACGACAEERCPMGAIGEQDGAYSVQPERCIGCGLCASACPTKAISLIRKPEQECQKPADDLMDWYSKRAAGRGIKNPVCST